MICRAARCYRVLSIASPGVNYTGCYLLRFLVLCCYTVTLCYLSPRMALRLLTIQGLVNRVARCYMVLSVASSGVTGCYPSRRPVLQGVICRVARCYRVFELSCSCLLAQHVVYLFMASRVMVPANIVW